MFVTTAQVDTAQFRLAKTPEPNDLQIGSKTTPLSQPALGSARLFAWKRLLSRHKWLHKVEMNAVGYSQ
jgi:hypothetical protein